MGNSDSSDQKFQASNYQRPGITNEEILALKNVFDSLSPENDVIQVTNLQKLYERSFDKKKLDQIIGIKTVLTFDEFFDIMASTIIEKKQSDPNIEIDSETLNITCILCPTTVDKGVQKV